MSASEIIIEAIYTNYISSADLGTPSDPQIFLGAGTRVNAN